MQFSRLSKILSECLTIWGWFPKYENRLLIKIHFSEKCQKYFFVCDFFLWMWIHWPITSSVIWIWRKLQRKMKKKDLGSGSGLPSPPPFQTFFKVLLLWNWALDSFQKCKIQNFLIIYHTVIIAFPPTFCRIIYLLWK